MIPIPNFSFIPLSQPYPITPLDDFPVQRRARILVHQCGIAISAIPTAITTAAKIAIAITSRVASEIKSASRPSGLLRDIFVVVMSLKFQAPYRADPVPQPLRDCL